jgi:hypothetical protein
MQTEPLSPTASAPAPHETMNSQPLTISSISLIEARPLPVQLSPINCPPSPINSPGLPATTQRKCRRTGRVACLPKLQRDMVNRMLSNGVHYKNIVLALDECDFNVTERNISNWATGGYLEWRLDQDLVLQNRLDQDHLLDHLRRDDATELPEVGLQAAATCLSQFLLNKTARADDLEANLGNVSQMVDLLCRLNRELGSLQKQRDDSRRSLGRAHDPARIKDSDETSAIEHERHYSNPPADSELPKPDAPPLLPPLPTSSFLAQCDREDEETRKAANAASFMATYQTLCGKKQNGSNVAQALLSAGAAGVSLAKSLPPAPANSVPSAPAR